MLDLKFVLENLALVVKKTESRGLRIKLDQLVKIAQEKKRYLRRVEDLRFEQNKASKLIGQMKKEKKPASSLISKMKKVSEEIKKQEEKLRGIEEKMRKILLNIPNIPHESVPEGKGPDDNLEMRRFSEQPKFSFPIKPHWEIGQNLGILDFQRAAKLAGSRFSVYLGAGAWMERALINSGRVQFVASKGERAGVREERLDMAKHASEQTMKGPGEEIGADFMLIGSINTIRDEIEGKAVMFYQTNLELIDMANNLKVWVGEKKIKKLIKRPKATW